MWMFLIVSLIQKTEVESCPVLTGQLQLLIKPKVIAGEPELSLFATEWLPPRIRK